MLALDTEEPREKDLNLPQPESMEEGPARQTSPCQAGDPQNHEVVSGCVKPPSVWQLIAQHRTLTRKCQPHFLVAER